MSYELIYTNGDSYIDFAQGHPVGYYLAKHFKAQHVNNTTGGASNSRILRTSIRDAIRYKDKKILFVISLGMLSRSETWINDFGSENKKAYDMDGDFLSFQLERPSYWKKFLPELAYQYHEAFYKNYNEEAAYINLLINLIGFTSYCQNNKKDYVIFSGNELMPNPLVDVNSPFIADLHNHIKSDDNIMPLNEFSFTRYCLNNGFVPFDKDKLGDNGHHCTEAHEHFSRFLIDRFKW